MTIESSASVHEERIFQCPPGVQKLARRKQLLGLVGIVGAIVAFAGCMRMPHVDPVLLQMVTTLPMLLGLGSLFAGRALARSTMQVAVGSQGVCVETSHGAQMYLWEHIGWSAVVSTPLNGKNKCLRLFDLRGKKLVELGDGFQDFESLCKIVAAKIESKEGDAADRIRRRKAKLTSVFLALAGLGFMSLGVANAKMTWKEIQDQRRLNDSGVQGDAEIVELRMAPNGRTPRLIYRLTTSAGKVATNNVQIDKRLWDSLSGVKSIPVFYLQDDPEVSALAFGEVKEAIAGNQGYLIAAFVTLMGAAFVVGATFLARGFDIAFNSETKRLSIKKFGT